MTAHDQLLQQLRESVGERAAEPAPRRRVFRGGGRALALAVALVVGAAALAAAQVGVLPGTGHHGSNTITYRQAAANAMQAAERTQACRPLEGRTATAAPAPAAAPLLAGPVDATAQRFVLRTVHDGPYVEGSARRVVLPGGVAIMWWLSLGQGLHAYADPAACGAQRIVQLRRAYPDPSSRLRQKAETFLATLSDVLPGAQTLWFMARVPGASSYGGSGEPVKGATVPPGLVVAGSNGYAVLAHPGATTATADGGHGYHRTLRVVRRFYALRPPRGTGAIVLREHDADGRVVGTVRLRD
jgi:hypothetical protein